MTREPYSRRKVCALCIGIFALNAWICHELFTAGFLQNLSSNEGAFTALARFFREHRTGYEWFPWFNGAMPIEFAYQPLLPVLSAVTGALTGWPDVRALHAVLATAYCFGPVALFLFAWDWSESIAVSLIAALAFSVASPAAMLIADLRIQTGLWGDLRLYNIVHYAEGSHHLSLAMLPLALLFVRRGIVRGGDLNRIAGAALCGLVLLASPFGAIDIALSAVAIVLAEGRGLRTVLCTGLVSWCWISPWLPPSLIATMRGGTWSTGGLFEATLRTGVLAAATFLAFALVWLATRSLSRRFDRFACLFALCMCAIPLGFYWLRATLVPLPHRYQAELDLAVCLLFGIAASASLRRAGPRMRTLMIAVLVVAAARQANVYRHYARGLIVSLNIPQTIEYRVTQWLDRNLPGQRAMIAGDAEYLFNVFSDNPQFGAGHQPTSPNPVQRTAVSAIYDGRDSGGQAARDAVLWLKVFGNQAIYVPGPASRDSSHALAGASVFEGILPVLWHEEDDTIYAVPQRSPALAHVIPRVAAVARQPRDARDMEPLRPYAAALDDPTLPLATLTWTDPSHGVIHARMYPEQLLSIQITYNRGWRARANGREVPVRSDKLDLIAIEPGCDGDCFVNLSFGATPEVLICRMLSALTTLRAGVLLIRRHRVRSRPPIGDNLA